MVYHNIPPLYDGDSRVLRLGSFPSVKSRETSFYYGHKQNRFWRVMASLFNEQTPMTVDDKKSLLLSHGIALWDVIAACDIEGSADNKIKNITSNDICAILRDSRIKAVFTNGNKATELYRKLVFPQTQLDCIALPSTSPANASYDLQSLINNWKIILQYTGGLT